MGDPNNDNDATSPFFPQPSTQTIPFVQNAKDFYRYQYTQNSKMIELLQGLQQLPDLLRELISSISPQTNQNAPVQALADLADGAAA